MDRFIIAQIIGFLVPAFGVVAVQCKNMKWNLFGQIMSNLFLALNLALLGGLSGAGVCITATLQTVTVFILNIKKIKFPTELSIIFAAAYTACSMASFNTFYDIIPCVAALLYAMSVIQTNSAVYRLYMLANALLWVVYDIRIGAYTTLITYAFIIPSILLGFIRHDIAEWKKILKK